MNVRLVAALLMGGAVLACGSRAGAVPVLTAGDHVLAPNTPNQEVQVRISGGDQIEGINFYLQVGDGGRVFDEAGELALDGSDTGPVITRLNLTDGTIFTGNNNGQEFGTWLYGLLGVSYVTTQSGTVAADGVLARVTLDTTGMFSGTVPFSLRWQGLYGGLDFPSDVPLYPPLVLVDGSLSIHAPEPGSVGLALVGLVCVAGLVWRRRRR